jgi:hypothetical protein
MFLLRRLILCLCAVVFKGAYDIQAVTAPNHHHADLQHLAFCVFHSCHFHTLHARHIGCAVDLAWTQGVAIICIVTFTLFQFVMR